MGALLNRNAFLFINQFSGKIRAVDVTITIIAQYLPWMFMLFVLYVWFKKDREYKSISLLSIYSAAIGLLINYIITLFYFHPRPFMMHIGKVLITHPPETSFPSDHTTFMLSIAVLFIYFKKARIPGLILALAGLIGGFARVYCGLHFPGDIIGSIGVSIVSSSLMYGFNVKLGKINDFIISLWLRIVRDERKDI